MASPRCGRDTTLAEVPQKRGDEIAKVVIRFQADVRDAILHPGRHGRMIEHGVVPSCANKMPRCAPPLGGHNEAISAQAPGPSRPGALAKA